MSISVSNISKHYQSQKALDTISFSIKEGEIVGFLGPNGAGKSTMMKILTTYLNASEGTAIVNGHDTVTEALLVQKSIGYLPEHNPLYTEMYVREYLLFKAQLHQISSSRIEEVISLTGLTTEAHKKINQLSKGYRQRIGLAAALLHDPKVLILDEPTTGLDPNQLVEIRELIRAIGQTKTILLSTHIMQEVEAMCDRVIIIKKGKIVNDSYLKDLTDASSQIIEVEFDYRIEDAFLKRIPNIKTVTNTYGLVYELIFDTTTDMRTAVFDFANENELKILQLRKQNKSLESLFRELTSE
ncbi:gliding motility-associated ABC transporter ATP-binding subunit GldA [Aquimarina sp. TRL1]|uniref:gliding motility-associated ABC transporter ATP-binding subunit GldA n=1 Tax=Aquimarina sp. (strain TRL1) TaxID=2736252 RepID=UPI00158E5C11|nr:gliding motility-associated ABC transporter ATP-binding subunit GldA [Aquimarina sp. TRL1]QKX05294.1 gliding motility-associated ABC transporter ATP-binding subunit GldA [Aquimarina sp. TRL1]